MGVADVERPSASKVIALDGPSGSGKSTVAARVASALDWQHLDTGSMYRAVTYIVLQAGIEPSDEGGVSALLSSIALEPSLEGGGTVTVGDRVLGQELRTRVVTEAVSAVSAQRAVRERLVALQRELAEQADGLVMEGRDIGTEVLPHARLKVYLSASEEVRAARRAGQRRSTADVAQVQADQARRDAADSSRAIGPLAAAPDAVLIDTSVLTADEVVAAVLSDWYDVAGGRDARTGAAAPASPVGGASAVEGSTTEPVETVRWRTDTRRLGAHAGPAYSLAFVAVAKPLARALFRALWKIEVTGRENIPPTGPVLIVGNHAGALDGPLVVIFNRRNVRILAKIELYHGLLGGFLRRAGQIPVDRGRPDRFALHAGIDVLKEGGVLGIFPEGTRAASGEMRDVRGGAAYLALHTPCTIIPVVCSGTSHAFPKGARLPRLRVPVQVDFGTPITIAVEGDPRARSSVATATAHIRTGMTDHLEQVRRRRVPAP